MDDKIRDHTASTHVCGINKLVKRLQLNTAYKSIMMEGVWAGYVRENVRKKAGNNEAWARISFTKKPCVTQKTQN